MKRIVSITEQLLSDLREIEKEEREKVIVPRCLIVEDNANDAELSANALQSLGVETTIATSGEEALSILAQAKERLRPEYHIVFLDLALSPSGKTGYDVLEEIKRSHNKVHVVIVSGNIDEDRIRRMGGAYFGMVTKPLLKPSVREIIAKHGVFSGA